MLFMAFLAVVLAVGSPVLIFYLFSSGNNNHPVAAVGGPNLLMTATSESRADVRATAQANIAVTPTAMAQAATNPYVANGGGVLNLDDPLQRDNYNWQKSSELAAGSSCSFSNGAYQVVMPGQAAGPCFAQATNYRNFTFQIQMTMIAVGPAFSGGGIVFRGNRNTQQYYAFVLYGSGRFTFDTCSNSSCTHLKGYPTEPQTLSSFNKTLGQPNTIAVVAMGETFSIYLNHQLAVGPVQNATLEQGMIGVFAQGGTSSGPDQTARIAFAHAKVWKM